MSKAVMNSVETVLTERLKLESPEFRLETAGEKVSGLVISPTFRGKPDSKRQKMIWDALDAEYGQESVQRVGSLLAFTPDEWNID